jgi:hypothetical protein
MLWAGFGLLGSEHRVCFSGDTGMFDGLAEIGERLLVAADQQKVAAFVPRPGESFEPSSRRSAQRWWPDLSWRTAPEDPVEASGVRLGVTGPM